MYVLNETNCPTSHPAVDDLVSAEPQHEHHGATEHQFERGPEHAHEAHQFEAAADVFLVLGFERANLGLFLHVGANQARSGKILLGARGDVGEHSLDALEALVNAAAESLDDDADGRQWEECVERQPGADRDHECQRASGVDDRVGRIHDRGAKQHADRVQIVGGARHDVARAMALVVGIRQAFEAREKIVAQVELDVARDADDDPAGQELEDSLGDGDTEQDGSVEQKLVAGDASVQIVGSFAQNEREQDPDAIGEEDTKRAREVSPAIAFHVGQQRSQVLR